MHHFFSCSMIVVKMSVYKTIEATPVCSTNVLPFFERYVNQGASSMLQLLSECQWFTGGIMYPLSTLMKPGPNPYFRICRCNGV